MASPVFPGRGGGVRGQKKGYTPKISLKFLALLINEFHFLSEDNFSDVGGWVGWPGLARAPNNSNIQQHSGTICAAVQQVKTMY